MQRFPFLTHRTMQEVAETEALALACSGALGPEWEMSPLGIHFKNRLAELLTQAAANNPPPVEPEDAA